MPGLVIAEYDQSGLAAATLKTVTAARAVAEEIHILVAGHGIGAVAEAAAGIEGVCKVLAAEHPVYKEQLAENVSSLIAALAPDYTHILAGASAAGKSLMPRVAALLEVSQISDMVAVKSPDTFVRSIYAGNLLATVHSGDPIKIITVRPAAFPAATPYDQMDARAPVEVVSLVKEAGTAELVAELPAASERPSLTEARVVVAGGRGFGAAAHFRLLDGVADKLHAAVGASRGAVDAGYAPGDRQVGLTGKIVAPDLYIAVGISGAMQHLAGMKESRVIVAINRDPQAPIFQVADYGLCADLFRTLPELEAQVDA